MPFATKDKTRLSATGLLTRILAAGLFAVIFAGGSRAQTAQVNIGSVELTIGGVQATVTPPQPTIPKNIASGVQIVVTQNGTQLTPAQVAQYLGGSFQLVGEYSGPGLTQTINVPQSAPPANSLVIDLPAVTTAGNYTLSNVQFLVNGAPVFDITPSVIPIQVIDQVLVTSVQTTPLTLDQIQQAGVVLDGSAYTGFQFTVGLAFQSQVVNVSFPVVFDPQGVPIPQPLSPPSINSPTGVSVPMPATIVPVLLQGTDGNGNPVSLPTAPGGGGGPIQIPSIIVIPGNVGFLKQFFSAQLYVSNGAPSGSNLTVDNIAGTISLPPGADGVVGTSDDPLALPQLTSGPQSPTMNVLAPPPGGGTLSVGTLNPGDTGQAGWTIRGDKEGYYTINFGINATLNGLPTGPISLTGSAMGGVLVRNPFFNMTFTVPATVRKGEQFNVYATVTNISQVAANNLTVSFDQAALSGVTLNSSASPVIPTLNAGDSTTLTYTFTSLQTGRVVASYLNFATNDGTTGNLNFTLGVFANGTPMSPDTIALPSAVDNLPSDVVDAAMRVIGQAWSVATAPALPAGVLPTTQNVVTQKALLLAEAGLRQSLGESLDNALRDLGVDFFSGSPVDPGFDQVLRTTPAGSNFVSVLGSHLVQPMTNAGGALPYEAQLAGIEASGPNFITFAVGSGTVAAPVSISLTDSAGNQITSSTPGGSVVGGALFPMGNNSGPYLGLVTSPTNSPYTLLLTGQASGSADISFSIPRGDGTVARGSITGVAVVQGQQTRVVADFANPNNLALQIDTAGNGTFATTVPLNIQVISPSGPTLVSASVIGSGVLNGASMFGVSGVALFDRVVDGTTASNVANYSIPNNSVASASKQLSGRMIFANLSQPEGPYVPTTFSISGIADQRGAIGPSGSVPLQSVSQNPGVVVSGRVLNADGTPSPNAVVTYTSYLGDIECHDVVPVGVATVPVQNNGTYQFRYVTQGPCGGGFNMSTKDPTTGDLRQVSGYVQAPGAQMILDLTLLGLGSVTGTVKDLSGNPVYNAQVGVLSGTDPQIGGTTFTDVNGNYAVNGITVGPVTVNAVKGVSVGSSAGNIQRAGTATVVNVTLNSGAVNITGVVTLIQNSTSVPVPGAVVAYYLVLPGNINPVAVGYSTTAADGSYSIKSVPAGSYSVTAFLGNNLTATQNGVSAAGDNLVIPLQVVAPSATGTVNGKVTFPNGTPAAGVIVYQGASGVLTAADGTYSLPGVSILPSQSQIITARTADYQRSGQASVVVGSTTPVNGVNITLSGLGSAQFTVLDPTGKPVVGQKVTIPDGSPQCGGQSQTTDANGHAVFTNLGIGPVQAIAISSNGSELISATATITQDGTTGFANMQFQGSGTVTGSVVDPNSQPVFGAIVQLTSNAIDMSTCSMQPMVTQSVQTGTTGTFQFTGVNVGKVGVTASQSFFPTQVGAQGNLAGNGATINFPLQLVNTISGVLSGTVYLPDGVTPAGAGIQVTANGLLPNVSVTTDTNGNFRFAKIFPEGSYTLTANDPVSGGTNQIRIYLRANQDMTQNLRLLGTGTINVTVVDGAGVPVNSAFVTLTEIGYPNGSFSGSLDPSNQGVLQFPNVFEGDFSVQAQDSFGRGGRASGTLPQGVSSVNVQVQLTTTGTVQGHFYMPDGVTPIPNATIQLTANGSSIGQATSLASGDIGSYSFQYVPAGPVQLKGLDPLTGRTGIAAGTITAQGQTLTLDIKAEGLDTITGIVTSNGVSQPGANVTIVSGNFQATTVADGNGLYLISGVPEGVIVATASLGGGFLNGTASGTISGDGNTLTLDVALRNSGTVSGQVLMADGVTPALPSSVSIFVGGVGGGTVNTTTDSQGNFSLQNVPSGSGTIAVKVLGGIDQASAQLNVPAGGTTSVQIKLNGTGGISGLALDSAGNPTAGTIVLNGTGAFPYSLTLTAASDGTFAVPQVLAGPFTVRLTANIGGFSLFGTASGTVPPSQTAKVTVQVQSSGTITASVLRPDGQTPAVGALVSIQTSGGKVTLQVQNDGTFTATGVPLGAFTVDITDPSTNGLAAIEGQTLSTNGQTANLGTITLDGNALSVIGTNPTDGTTGVGINQPITVAFSESLANTGGISVTNGSSNIPMNSSLSSDGKTVTLQGQLPDGIQLALNITNQVTDIFGRQLLVPQTIHFTTVDLTPPTVTSILPANGAIQVPANSSVVVMFSKALSTTANLSNVITVSTTAGNIPGTTALTAPNVLTFTPSATLANNTQYTITVDGAVSFGGNVQIAAFTSSFVSPETIAPVLQMSTPANGAYTANPTPVININLSDPLSGINPATGTLAVDGQTVRPTVGSTFMSFVPTAPLTNGSHNISASVANNAGIIGTLSSSFTVDTTQPSIASLSGIASGQKLQGQISISASASDPISGIASINFLVDGTVRATLTGSSFSTTFTTANLSDGPHNFAVQAVNGAGTSGQASSAIQAFVENHPLSVTITSPANGAPVKGQVTVIATASQPVQQITFTLGTQTVSATSSPYQGTLSLAGVPDGAQTITVTAQDFAGDTASANVTIDVMQTPPPAPNANLINAEPPSAGISLVHGAPGAVSSGGLKIIVVDAASQATASTTSASDGSFATNITAAVSDTLSLTATDVVGNVSSPTLITVRSTPSLPPSSGNTSLVYQGDLVDRVGGGTNGLSPDGQLDAVFTLSLNIGQDVTRTISYINLVGPQTRSTQPNVGTGALGVASDVGSPLLNGSNGQISFPVTTGATLTLFAADNGLIQPGATYTVTAVFTDGSQFVASYTVVAPADQQYVAHSATITASPAAVIVNSSTPGTTILTITNIHDINDTVVPDGAWIALTDADMASLDPRGNQIRSAGGVITNGTTATNNSVFQVFQIQNGTVTATYSSGTVSPSSITGALVVIQMQAADSNGNVLGTKAVGTLDLNIRASSDQAVVMPTPGSVYADGNDHRVNFSVLLTNGSGVPVADGTKVIIAANSCAARFSNGNCIISAGGQISGGTPNSSGQQVFTTSGGTVSGQYSDSGLVVGTAQINIGGNPGAIQVLPANSSGSETSSTALGFGTVTLAGAGSSELDVSPSSVPYVFPTSPLVQVLVHHLHDMRANLVPDGAEVILAANSCAARFDNGNCVISVGGTMGGSSVANGSGQPVYTLSNNQTAATYSIQNATVPAADQVEIANVQLLAANNNGTEISSTNVAIAPINVLGVDNAVGSAQPITLLGDGAVHTSTVTFGPILDAFGNQIPDGSLVVASAASCAGRFANGNCVISIGGQIVNGSTSSSGSTYKAFTIQNGSVSITYADQNVTSSLGQSQIANVMLLEANSTGGIESSTELGVVPISIVGLTSAQGTTSPTAVFANGGDFRSQITISNFKDAAGNPVPDGTQIGLSAVTCASLTTANGCILSAGGQIIGGTTATNNSSFQLFTITNGQVVAQYSSTGVKVDSGEQTAVVSVVAATPQGNVISRTAVATVSVQLLAPGSAMVAVNPVDVFSDGATHLSQITISGLLDSDGVTPVPDGAKVGLTAINCEALNSNNNCISSPGGQILSGGVSPGDGTAVPSNSNFEMFTVAGGKVQAVYSDQGVSTGLNQTQVANIAVVPLDSTGSTVLTRNAIGSGGVNLHGTASATASGPASLSISAGATGTVTFSGIKDSAGNTVPDGTLVLATVGNCVTLNSSNGCNGSTGGTLSGGTTSTWNSNYQQFTVFNGSVTMTYSTSGATSGTATVQLIPAMSNGTGIGRNTLIGGTWAITITP